MRNAALVRKAKDRLAALVKDRPWYRGIGIARHHGDLILRLNVSPTAKLGKLPKTFNGIPIEIVRIEGYERRHS